MTEHAISATLKAGTDYDSPWVVVYGDSPDDVEFKLRNLGGVLAATVEAGSEIRALHAAAKGLGAKVVETGATAQQAQPSGWGNSTPQTQPSWSQPQQAVPQQAGPRLHPEGKTCSACPNVLQYKDVYSKAKGKSFQFWECPQRTGRDSVHSSEFAN